MNELVTDPLVINETSLELHQGKHLRRKLKEKDE